jgi:hypothetical protein
MSKADGPVVEVRKRPLRLAVLDGFKVESLATVRGDDGRRLILVGTDDEDYGGVLRPLPR